MWKEFEKWALKHEAILLILGIVFLLRVPSLFEPYWYGDEGIYLTIGQAMRQGVELYRGIHDNKPPLLYLVTAIAGSQYWLRFIALGWNLATVVLFWNLAKKWWQDVHKAVWSTIIFGLLTSLPWLEGNIANAELFFLLLTVAAFGWLYEEKNEWVAGLLLGLAALFKMPAILEVGVWPLFWFMRQEKGWLGKSTVLGVMALVPLVISIAWYGWRGTLPAYLIAAGLQNVPYLASWSAANGMVGTLVGRAIIAGGLIVGLWVINKKLSKNSLLLAIWMVVTLFAALLSGRPYPHYLLQMAAVGALGITTIVWGATKERWWAGGWVGLTLVAIMIFRFNTYPVLSYYVNFGKWVTVRQSQEQYFGWFDGSVARNYKIAKTVTDGCMLDDRIFVWGDVPVIYALSKRQPATKYTAGYHIKDFGAEKETLILLANNPPQYIVVVDNPDGLPGLSDLLARHYMQVENVEGAVVYRYNENLWKY